MKFRVGDKVRVRKDLKERYYDGVFAVSDMVRLANKIVTIQAICGGDEYRIEEEGFTWSGEMFEEFKIPTKEELFNMPTGIIITVVNKYKKEYDFIKINNIFIKINNSNHLINEYEIGEDLSVNCWEYDRIIKIQVPNYSIFWEEIKEDKKEMTIAEIEEKLGYRIKIVKEREENE